MSCGCNSLQSGGRGKRIRQSRRRRTKSIKRWRGGGFFNGNNDNENDDNEPGLVEKGVNKLEGVTQDITGAVAGAVGVMGKTIENGKNIINDSATEGKSLFNNAKQEVDIQTSNAKTRWSTLKDNIKGIISRINPNPSSENTPITGGKRHRKGYKSRRKAKKGKSKKRRVTRKY